MKGKGFLKEIGRNVKSYVKVNSSTILTGVAIVGVVATAVSTGKATVKATKIINEAECNKKEDLTTFEKFKLVAPVYISPVLFGASTIACMLGSNILNKRQQASLISAYGLLDNSYKEYKNTLKKLYGEETHNKIIDSIMAEKAEKVDIWSTGLVDSISLLGDDDGEPRLFYEEYSGRYFESTMERVMNAEYHLNRNYVLRGSATLNELYEFLGIETTDYGDSVGWGYADGICWIDFNHRKTTLEDGLECYILEMPFGPSAGFDDDY